MSGDGDEDRGTGDARKQILRLVVDWDLAKALDNRRKHGVSFEDALSVFDDPLSLSISDRESDPDEDRWITIGEARDGNLLLVVHTWAETTGEASVRIISARRPTRNEARQYREGS